MRTENILKKVAIKATENASKSFSKMAGQDINVEVVLTQILKFRREIADIDLEARVAGVYLPVSGDVNGATLLIFSEDFVFVCLDRLFKRETARRHELTEIEKSALMEFGNILCGSFLTVFSNMLKIKCIENIPSLKIDMYGAIVEHLITQFAHKPENAFILKVKLVLFRTEVIGYVVLIVVFEEMEALIEKMGKLETTV